MIKASYNLTLLAKCSVLMCSALNLSTFCLVTSVYWSFFTSFTCNQPTFLTSILMAVTALDVIPFVVVLHAKCVHAVFSSKIIWLIFSPSCKVPSSTIRPSEATLCGDVIQSQPGFFAVMTMLQKHVFFIVVYVNKDWVFLTAFAQRCGPVCACFTCIVTKSTEMAPVRITDVCN